MPPKIFRHTGTPGSGKTTTILRRLAGEAAAGLPLYRLYLTTFTRALREEAAARISEAYPDATAEDVKDRVRTLHSLALSSCRDAGVLTLGKDEDQILTPSGKMIAHYAGFCEKFDLPFDPPRGAEANLAEDDDLTERPSGNLFFQLSSFITQHPEWGPGNYTDAQARTGIYFKTPDEYDVADLLTAWADYKADWRLFEHDDYVKLAVDHKLPIYTKVLAVDEFQDVSPLQYELFQCWLKSPDLERVYIAGDVDQSVYAFRGAHPRFMGSIVATDWDVEAGLQSWRCPARVTAVARALIPHSKMLPRPAEGVLKWHSMLDGERLARLVEECYARTGHTYLLTRTVRQARRLSTKLRDTGIPHRSVSDGRFPTWASPRIELLLRVLRLVNRGRPLPRDDFEGLLAIAKAHTARDKVRRVAKANRKGANITTLDFEDEIPAERVLKLFPDATSVPAIAECTKLSSPKQLDAVRNAIDRDTDLLPENTYIDTIHAAKGRTAQSVILCPAYSDYLEERYHEDTEFRAEEHRIYYVGVTRTREELHIISGGTVGYRDAPPFRDLFARRAQFEAPTPLPDYCSTYYPGASISHA